jgi:hypothetical protein
MQHSLRTLGTHETFRMLAAMKEFSEAREADPDSLHYTPESPWRPMGNWMPDEMPSPPTEEELSAARAGQSAAKQFEDLSLFTPIPDYGDVVTDNQMAVHFHRTTILEAASDKARKSWLVLRPTMFMWHGVGTAIARHRDRFDPSNPAHVVQVVENLVLKPLDEAARAITAIESKRSELWSDRNALEAKVALLYRKLNRTDVGSGLFPNIQVAPLPEAVAEEVRNKIQRAVALITEMEKITAIHQQLIDKIRREIIPLQNIKRDMGVYSDLAETEMLILSIANKLQMERDDLPHHLTQVNLVTHYVRTATHVMNEIQTTVQALDSARSEMTVELALA